MKRGRWWWWTSAAVVVLVLIAGRLALRPRTLEVGLAVVARGPVEDLVTNSEAGTVESIARARLGAERTGRVATIRFEEGARVRAGAPLVDLDASTARTALAAARRDAQALDAALSVARSNDRLARSRWERIARLFDQQLVSADQRDEARWAVEAAAGEVLAAEARLHSARAAVSQAANELGHLVVTAPFDGVVVKHLVELGESVIPGQPVIELLGTERLFTSAPIDERDAGSLRQGQAARVSLDAYPGVSWPGRLTRISPVVEELKQQNRTLEVEVTFDSLAGRPEVRAGMTADVEIVLGRSENVLRVPASAVLESRRVYVLRGDRARLQAFEPGRRNWEWVEVRSGLAPGDRIVTTLDRPGIKDGVAVREERSAEPAGGAEAAAAERTP